MATDLVEAGTLPAPSTGIHKLELSPAVAHHRAHHDMYDSGCTTPVGADHGHGPCPDPGTVYTVGLPPPEALEDLGEESRACLTRLAEHKTAPEIEFGVVRQAAVLVTLYQRPGEDGLRVVLTTRGSHLRRNPGQTALPGGKRDPEDPSAVYTARREAHEEVGLPPDHPDIYTIAILDPVLTVLPLGAHMKNHIVVTPVVAFVADPALIGTLVPNPDEVDRIFDHPLSAIFTGHASEPLAEVGEWWPFEEDTHSQEDRVGSTGAYRMHRFRTSHTSVRGFTSNVLISTATLAYGAEPAYGHFSPGQTPFAAAIADIVERLPAALLVPETRAGKIEWGKSNGERVASGETYYTRG